MTDFDTQISVITLARNLMAVLNPVTGTRASGPVTVVASGADVTLPRSSYALPVVDNEYRDDLVFKVADGPNADDSWTVTSAGTDVTFESNLGGSRHNLAAGTKLFFDPVISGIASATVKTTFTGGTNPSEGLGLNDIAFYESFRPPPTGIDPWRAGDMGPLPVAMLYWDGSEPADGSTVQHTRRETRTGRNRVLYRERFMLIIFSDRIDADARRRAEGLRILDACSMLLTDRRSIDGMSVSSPSGIQIQQRLPLFFVDKEGYQRYYAYAAQLSLMHAFQRLELRSYNDLETIVMDVIRPQIPALPNQGDMPLVGDGSPGKPGYEIDTT